MRILGENSEVEGIRIFVFVFLKRIGRYRRTESQSKRTRSAEYGTRRILIVTGDIF